MNSFLKRDNDKYKNQEGGEKVIQWEDFEQELARLCSLTSAVDEAKQKRKLLQEKLQANINVEAESLGRLNELDEMHEKTGSRKLVIRNMDMRSNVLKEEVKRQEEQLSAKIRSLLMAGSNLSVASKRLQENSRLLCGEKGLGRLRTSHRLLKLRQQQMISQISLLYPVKIVMGHAREQELESFTVCLNSSGLPPGLKPDDQGSLTIAGLHLTMIAFTKMSFFTDKKEVQRSGTALGYVAHAVSLIASYLLVPLRYPLKLGGSRSYIRDFAPSIEPTSSESASNLLVSESSKYVEFPLFLEGQDSTRAAYAVFLLNKDLEQLMSYIGVNSLGPRHVLANLKELLKTILSHDYIETMDFSIV